MKREEIRKLKTGDVITCDACPTYGCNGKPAKVTTRESSCGCLDYYHKGNTTFFAWDNINCTKAHGSKAEFYLCSEVAVGNITLVMKGDE